MKKFVLLCSTAVLPSAVFAQSTGTVTTEEITITGARTRNVAGVQAPDTTKAKATITKELIERQQPGQTILNVINLTPGVNFTNSDPYGSAGGNIRIRGFDGNRISLTWDGMPLNDSGNYAIFSNQLLDPEVIEQVNVGLGVTDVDSPTASAAGGTVNYRTILPTSTMGARFGASLGDFHFRRLFGVFQTGSFTPWGTRAFISASHAENDKFKGPGEIDKYQFNGRIYQPLGAGGDFVSLAGHYNRNRNNFYRNPSYSDLTSSAVLGSGVLPATSTATAANPIVLGDFDSDQERAIANFDYLDQCARAVPHNGLADSDSSSSTANTTVPGLAPSTCSNYYNLNINPSNTGNIRGQSRFTLHDGLILTVDPSYQYVLANGGGNTTLAESSRRARGGDQTSSGVDFNGDGDFLDTVRFYTPNNTNTNRFGLTSSLIWTINPQHRVRVAYTFDRAHHRQTGEWGYLEPNGDPESVFGGRNATPVLTADGYQLQQRDRTSIAMLNQISGEYIGKFFNDALRVEVGVRRPFFKRELNTHCPIEAVGSSGFAYCTDEPILARIASGSTPPTQPAGTGNGTVPIFVNQGDDLTLLNPSTTPFRPVYAPFKAQYKFGKVLPNVGFDYKVMPAVSIFGNYAKGFSSPRTDNLYRAPVVDVQPEETNAFDLGARYSTSMVQAQLAAWKIDYKNRIVTSFDPEQGISLDRNVGKVNSYGFDASVAVRPVRSVSLLAFASYTHAELKDNVLFSTANFNASVPAGQPQVPPAGLIFCSAPPTATSGPVPTCAPTAGRMVTETPKWQFGGRAAYSVGPFSVGVQGKHVGSRFVTDVNDVKVKGYMIVDMDARFVLDDIVHTKNTYLQFNLQNVFDKFYFGNLTTQLRGTDTWRTAVGFPRTFSASLNVGF